MRNHILTVAEGLFYREGIRAVGVDRVIAEAKIAKATLYRHFPGKEDLVVAYLTARHERGMTMLNAYMSDGADAPAEQMLRLFDFLYERALPGGFRGCAFLLAVAESEESDRVRAIASLHKNSLRELLEVRAKHITNRPQLLAQEVALCYEGALAMMSVFRDPAAATVARRAARHLIDRYIDQPALVLAQ